MEIVRPEAVRQPDGTELYISHEEAMRPFISPQDERAFSDVVAALSPVNALAMFRVRQDVSTSAPMPLRHREDQFRWIRQTQD